MLRSYAAKIDSSHAKLGRHLLVAIRRQSDIETVLGAPRPHAHDGCHPTKQPWIRGEAIELLFDNPLTL